MLSYSNVEILTKKVWTIAFLCRMHTADPAADPDSSLTANFHLQPIIHPYFPYFHLEARADVLVFRPTRGLTLGEHLHAAGRSRAGVRPQEGPMEGPCFVLGLPPPRAKVQPKHG
jgi:hypothetical protein